MRLDHSAGACGDRVSANVPRLENVRETTQRRAILEAFVQARDHLSMEDLLAAARKAEPSIGSSTVYRTMRLLVDQGLAVEHHFEGHVTRYEPSGRARDHHHLVCRACKAIVEFEEPRLERLQGEIAARHGFELQVHRHVLYGVCARCRDVAKEAARPGHGRP
jgi:Fur family ferric uptake transcriptional regulator